MQHVEEFGNKEKLDQMESRAKLISIGRFVSGDFFCVLAVMLLSALSLGILVPVLPPLFQEKGMTAGLFGVLFAGYSGIEGLFEGVWGWVSDRIGVAPIMLTRMFTLAGLLLLFTRFDNLMALSLLMLLRGILEAPIWPLSRAFMGRSMALRDKGWGMALAQSVIIAGISVGSQLGGSIKDFWGYDTALYSALALLVVGGLFIALRYSVLSESNPTRREKVRTGDSLSSQYLRRLAVAGGTVGVGTMGFVTLMAFVPIFGDQVVGLDGTRIGSVMMVSGLVSLGVLIPAGGLSDRTRRKPLIIAGLLVCGLSIGLIALTHSFWGLSLAVSSAMIGRALMLPPARALASDVMPVGFQGSAMGLVGVCEAVGATIGPALAGWAWEAHGAGAAFFCTGLLVGLGALAGIGLIREGAWLNNG